FNMLPLEHNPSHNPLILKHAQCGRYLTAVTKWIFPPLFCLPPPFHWRPSAYKHQHSAHMHNHHTHTHHTTDGTEEIGGWGFAPRAHTHPRPGPLKHSSRDLGCCSIPERPDTGTDKHTSLE